MFLRSPGIRALFLALAILLIPRFTYALDENAADIVIENNCERSTVCAANTSICTCSITQNGQPVLQQIVDKNLSPEACADACTRQNPGSQSSFQCTNECGVAIHPGTVQQLESTQPVVKKDPVIPQLNVQIPGLSEADLAAAITVDPVTGNQQNSLLGVYIQGLYRFLLGVSALVGVVMVIIAGFQWLSSRGNSGSIKGARERIENVIVGLVLLFGAATIAFVIDPRTVSLRALTIPVVEREEFPPEGEDLDLVSRGDLSAERVAATSPYIISNASNNTLAPEAADALAVAAKYLYDTYGERIRVASASRDLSKQAELFYNNCLVPGGYCSPPTCNVASQDIVQKIDGRFRMVGELAGQSSSSYIISKIASTGNVAACPHTSGIAVDAWCQSGGNYTVDPQCQLRVMEAMQYAGFCRLASEAWHFELNAYHVSRNCSFSNNATPAIMRNGTTYTPPANCAKYDYKHYKCVAYRN